MHWALKRGQLLAELDRDEMEPGAVQQIIIAVEKDRNTSLDGASMHLYDLANRLRELSDDSGSRLSVVLYVRKRFQTGENKPQ